MLLAVGSSYKTKPVQSFEKWCSVYSNLRRCCFGVFFAKFGNALAVKKVSVGNNSIPALSALLTCLSFSSTFTFTHKQ